MADKKDGKANDVKVGDVKAPVVGPPPPPKKDYSWGPENKAKYLAKVTELFKMANDKQMVFKKPQDYFDRMAELKVSPEKIISAIDQMEKNKKLDIQATLYPLLPPLPWAEKVNRQYRGNPADKIPDYEGLDEKDCPLGASKFGGLPHLPRGWSWPDNTKLFFISQINLADVVQWDIRGILPSTGILYYFTQEKAKGKHLLWYYDGPMDQLEVLKPPTYTHAELKTYLSNDLKSTGLLPEINSLISDFTVPAFAEAAADKKAGDKKDDKKADEKKDEKAAYKPQVRVGPCYLIQFDVSKWTTEFYEIVMLQKDPWAGPGEFNFDDNPNVEKGQEYDPEDMVMVSGASVEEMGCWCCGAFMKWSELKKREWNKARELYDED